MPFTKLLMTLLILITGYSFCNITVKAENYQTVPTRKDATTSFIVNKQKGKFRSAAILFPEGGYNISLNTKKRPEIKNNFLVHSRRFFLTLVF